MSTLFKFKEWLSVAGAAKHLASVFGEEVTEADVLRLALDGQLRLSINFVNGGYARPGVMVPIDEATYEEVVVVPGSEPLRLYGGPRISTDGIESHVLRLEKYVASVRGIYDLPMIGGERIQVEDMYQQLTGGPDYDYIAMDGAFIESIGGQLCQLQDDFDDNEYIPGSTASLDRIKRRIRAKKIATVEAEKLLNQHKEDRKKFLDDRKSKPQTESYYPGGSLPKDVVFVVRTEALTDFIKSAQVEQESEMTPEEWRSHAATVLAKHNGNKTRAAKELGISRQRVSQLTNSPAKAGRKPLAFSAQDPFGVARQPASNRRS